MKTNHKILYFNVILTAAYRLSALSADDLPVGARALGMGSAYVALSNTADAIFLNVGGLGRLTGTEVSLFYQKPFGISELNYGTVAANFPIWNRRFGLGLLTFGNNLYREQALSIAYSHKYQNRFYYGLALRYQSISIEGYGSSGTVGLELGLVIPLSSRLDWGFIAKNVNRPTIGQANQHLPQTFSSGISSKALTNLILNFEIFKDVRFPAEARFGCEFRPFDNIALRAGVANHPSRFSAGLGLAIKRITIDYAFFTHQTSVSVLLGNRTPKPSPDVPVAGHIGPLSSKSLASEIPEEVNKAAAEKININKAGITELTRLPGIGESLANAIVAYRQQHGDFIEIDDLQKVPGIGKSKLAAIKDFIVINDDKSSRGTDEK
jgi:competence ComEA-like helix-hairpin-helix protein